MRTVFYALVTAITGCSSPERDSNFGAVDPDLYVVPASTQVRTGEIKYYIDPDSALIKHDAKFMSVLWGKITQGDVTYTQVEDKTAADLIFVCNLTDSDAYWSTLHPFVKHDEKIYSIFVDDCKNPDKARTDLFYIFGHEIGIPDNNTPGKTYYIMSSVFLDRPGGLPSSQEIDGLTKFFNARRAGR